MKVNATWQHVFAVTREIEIDEASFKDWRDRRYGPHVDDELALAVWIEELDIEDIAAVFGDWKAGDPLPADFEFQYLDVIDVKVQS